MAASTSLPDYGAVEGLAQQPPDSIISNQQHHRDFSVDSRPKNSNNVFRRFGGDAMADRRLLTGCRNAVVCGLVIGAIAATTFGGGYRAATGPQTSGDFAEISTNTGLAKDPTIIRPAATTTTTTTTAGSTTTQPLAFTALNFYHVRDGKPGQDYPWLKDMKLIEPYRETTLSVTNPRDGSEYRWEVRAVGGGNSPEDEVQATSSGQTTIIVLKTLDEHVVTLEEVDPTDGRVSRRLVETVMVKYVRREIRTLTEEEKEELLDAMHQLWVVRVDGGNGREIYGSEYADIYAMNRLHFKAATHGKCDHFHDGLGFLVSHSIISNTFEFSLQLVNPKLTLPYWDFTIENSAGMEYEAANPYTRTPLLHSSWFGTFDLKDLIVKDGRWAYTEVPSARPNNPGALETDIYGRLRSPWNMNDRKFMARGGGKMCHFNADEAIPWPTCKTHYDLVTAYNSFYDWVWEGMGIPHAPVHFWLGGVVDCATTFYKIQDLVGRTIAKDLAFMANAYRKAMFCDGSWGCDGLVDQDIHVFEVAERGICGCLGYDLTQGDDYKEVMTTMVFLDVLLADFDGDTIRKVVQLFCNGVIGYGENGQSSSSLDPMFWPMHPTMERMWQFTVLTGKIKDFSWPDGDITITLPDGTTYSEVTSSYYGDCEGHRGSDVFPYGLLDTDDDGFKARTGISGSLEDGATIPTNREVLDALNPEDNSLSYIYDNFKWPHCVADGYNFDDAWYVTRSFDSVDRRLFETESPKGRLYTQFKRDMAKRMEERAQDQSEG